MKLNIIPLVCALTVLCFFTLALKYTVDCDIADILMPLGQNYFNDADNALLFLTADHFLYYKFHLFDISGYMPLHLLGSFLTYKLFIIVFIWLLIIFLPWCVDSFNSWLKWFIVVVYAQILWYSIVGNINPGFNIITNNRIDFDTLKQIVCNVWTGDIYDQLNESVLQIHSRLCGVLTIFGLVMLFDNFKFWHTLINSWSVLKRWEANTKRRIVNQPKFLLMSTLTIVSIGPTIFQTVSNLIYSTITVSILAALSVLSFFIPDLWMHILIKAVQSVCNNPAIKYVKTAGTQVYNFAVNNRLITGGFTIITGAFGYHEIGRRFYSGVEATPQLAPQPTPTKS